MSITVNNLPNVLPGQSIQLTSSRNTGSATEHVIVSEVKDNTLYLVEPIKSTLL